MGDQLLQISSLYWAVCVCVYIYHMKIKYVYNPVQVWAMPRIFTYQKKELNVYK